MYTIGLSSIEVGEQANDGGMGQDLEQLGLTYQDTCKFNQDDPETTDFFAEEVDDAVFSISRAGKTNFNFSIMNPELVTLQKVMGGTITGAGDTASWTPPDSMPVIERSVRITPQQGIAFDVPRMSITAKINGEFSKKGLLMIDVVGKALKPTKAGLGKFKAYKVATA